MEDDAGHHPQQIHKSFAPLSSAQTLELVRQVNEELRALQSSLGSLRKEHAETVISVAALQNEGKRAQTCLGTLESRVTSTDHRVDQDQKNIKQIDSWMRQVEGRLEKTNSNVEAVSDVQQHAKVRWDATQRDFAEMRELLAKLQRDLEKNTEGDTDDRGFLEEIVKKMKDQQVLAQQAIDDQRKAQYATDVALKRLANEIEQNMVVVKTVEGHADEAGKGVKALRRRLDDQVCRSQQLEEDHDRTKAKVAECQAGGFALKLFADGLEKRIQQALQELRSAQDQIGGAHASLKAQGGRLLDAEDALQRVDLNNKNTSSQLRALHSRLEETSQVAHYVKEGLRETNAIVLPNILMDGIGSGMGGEKQSSTILPREFRDLPACRQDCPSSGTPRSRFKKPTL
mmetsp:Transcript_109893/g.310939  ORF Transcript_109893/g.310939 Transcript_109893/m.310939 type:complete len:400 (+) Transcript_109893:115-1314(+)